MARPGIQSLFERATAGALATLGACAGGAQAAAPHGLSASTMTLTSSAFQSNGPMPIDATCDGADRSPPLAWSAPPPATASFAVIVDDPDSPSGAATHWLLYNLPASALNVPEGADPDALGADTGTGDNGRPVYFGPCPPSLELHRFVFRLYALNKRLDVPPGSRRDALEAAMSGHVLGEGVLVGTFAH